jgi:hypothetical protein
MRMYTIKSGIRTIKKYGVDTDIINMIIITSIVQYKKSLKDNGNWNSIELMSLLNLFKMRPIGVDSKKLILHLNIEESIES